jgi:peroxiredoxin
VELAALQEVLPQITAMGASLVAVSPQLEKYNLKLIAEKVLTFEVLSDPANLVASKFNLLFTLPEDLREVYLSFGIDLAKFNGDESWTLPMPARFVIDQGGVIRAADVNPDYTVRPEPGATVEVLKSLVKPANR